MSWIQKEKKERGLLWMSHCRLLLGLVKFNLLGGRVVISILSFAHITVCGIK